MVELFSLVKGLNEDELLLVRTSFKKTNSGEETVNLSERLFEFILVCPVEFPTDNQLSEAIYFQSAKLSAVAKLKSRLFQHIIDNLSSDLTLCKENIFDDSDRQELRIRKKMLQFRAMYRKKNRPDYKVLVHLLSEVMKDSKEHELYDVMLEALHHKMLILKLRKGFDEVIEIEKQIEFYTFAQNALLKTHEHYVDLIANKVHVQKMTSQQVKILFRNAIEEIEGFIKITNSSFMKYLCKMLQLDELQRERKHSATIDVCLDLIGLLTQHKILYRNERMGNIYDNISHCHVYNNDFSNAFSSVKKAQEYYSPNTRSFIISKEQEFYATFYAGQYQQARSIIIEILDHPQRNAGEYRADKFMFLKACTLFQMGEFKDSLEISNHALKISKDKGRWDLGLRYIRIMSLVDSQNLDTAYDYIEAFRKNIQRNAGKDLISKRDELIYRTMNEFAFLGFSTIPSPKLIDLVNKLEEKDTEYSWNYYTHELIPVHEWIQSKIKADKGVKVVLAK